MAKKQNPNRIAELRQRRRMNQAGLADAVSAHWMTISKLERGQMQLTQEWMGRLATALGVEPAELLSDSPAVRTIYISGAIRDKGIVQESLNPEGPQDDEDISIPFDVQIGAVEPDRTVWYFVTTGMFYPYFHLGDAVRFSYQLVRNLEDAVGRLCLLELDAEPPRKVVGVLARGRDQELFEIQIPGSEPIQGVRIKEAAPATMALFAPQFITDESGYPLP
jgi:DNA-binding XRE family transcriptional regulator